MLALIWDCCIILAYFLKFYFMNVLICLCLFNRLAQRIVEGDVPQALMNRKVNTTRQCNLLMFVIELFEYL